MDRETQRMLSDADRALGRLDGVATMLPNPDLFVAMYVRHEALLSSQIEGTQSTLDDILEYEVQERSEQEATDPAEVINYVRAMNHGLQRLGSLPLSLRLLREIHAELLQGVRGSERQPGEFRRSQNWIGPANCTLADAEFVPPPVDQMQRALGELEKFLHDPGDLPALVLCALAHAQFETIHPFLDGNGRIGRLLITLLLCERGILQQPLLYLSLYLKAHRAQYYDRLMAVRNEGDWESWIKFFLRGVYEVSRSATDTARAILGMREDHRSALAQSANALKLLDSLFVKPVVTIRSVEKELGCSYTAAGAVVDLMQSAGVLRETTGYKRNRRYRYEPLISLFKRPALTADVEDPGATAVTDGAK